MPYIKQAQRFEAVYCDSTAGQLNYSITVLINRYLSDRDLNYQLINDVVGALEGAKLEFTRRIAVPYENRKLHENGDVYSPELLNQLRDPVPPRKRARRSKGRSK